MIDTLIFDMGNVLVHYQGDAVTKAYCDDPTIISWVDEHLLRSSLWNEFDKGTIDEKQLYDTVCGMIDDPSYYPIIEKTLMEWPKYNLKTNTDMVQVVKYGLDHGMDVILLSNAPLRIHEVLDQYIPYYDQFKAIYISSDLKMVKPDPKIFEYVLDHSNKAASQCLFVDDLKRNCDAAKSLGLATWCYHDGDGQSIIQWLDQSKQGAK